MGGGQEALAGLSHIEREEEARGTEEREVRSHWTFPQHGQRGHLMERKATDPAPSQAAPAPRVRPQGAGTAVPTAPTPVPELLALHCGRRFTQLNFSLSDNHGQPESSILTHASIFSQSSKRADDLSSPPGHLHAEAKAISTRSHCFLLFQNLKPFPWPPRAGVPTTSPTCLSQARN